MKNSLPNIRDFNNDPYATQVRQLQRLIQEGTDSGPGENLDVEEFLRRARAR